MSRERISQGSDFERLVGYSRAVVDACWPSLRAYFGEAAPAATMTGSGWPTSVTLRAGHIIGCLAFLAWLLLGEDPGPIGLVGIVTVSIGVFLTQGVRWRAVRS